jgi:TrmH family RNA methyltransferase
VLCREWAVPPPIKRIYSENNDFQYVDALRRRREKRHRQREFFVEGVRPINQALAHNWTINAFVYSRDRRLSDWAAGILARSRARMHIEVPLPLLDKLSNKAEPSEMIALVAMPDDDISRIPLGSDLSVVVFDRPASPGNLGTMIRSCDALRADGLVITGHAVDLYDPETISATTGSFFALPTVRVPSAGDLLPWFDAIRRAIGPFNVVGSSAKAAIDLSAHDFTQPTVLVVGNEMRGLSVAFEALCDTMVTIPIAGSATSLNVACAASIMLYEIDRQRRARS